MVQSHDGRVRKYVLIICVGCLFVIGNDAGQVERLWKGIHSLLHLSPAPPTLSHAPSNDAPYVEYMDPPGVPGVPSYGSSAGGDLLTFHG